MDALEKRVMTLEVQREVDAMKFDAFQTIFIKVLRELHERGHLPFSALTASLESGAAFAQGAFDSPPSKVLRVMIEQLKAIQAAYEERDKPR